MIVNDVAHLCGYFSVKNREFHDQLPERWNPVIYEVNDIQAAGQYYYHEFVDLCMNQVKGYQCVLDEDISVNLRGGRTHKVHLDRMNLYFYPFGIVLFSVDISQKDVELSDALQALALMRNITASDLSSISEFENSVLKPMKEVCALTGNPAENFSLMECGNKLKIFHSVVCDESKTEEELSTILFGAGTLAVYDENDPMSFSKDYYESIMSSGRLSVFRNWKALGLLDTFTIVAEEIKEYMLEIWSEDYFRKIYLYTLFMKFLHFRINKDFREGVRSIKSIRKEITLFDTNYAYPKISYNFLPVEFYRIMVQGLDIEEEKAKITEKVNEEKDRREAEVGDKMNLFLGVITCLTLFSAIWDFSCLMDGLFVFGDSIGTVTGVRACTMVIISAICFVALLIRRASR